MILKLEFEIVIDTLFTVLHLNGIIAYNLNEQGICYSVKYLLLKLSNMMIDGLQKYLEKHFKQSIIQL